MAARLAAAVLLVFCVGGCRATADRERGATGLWDNAATVRGPAETRCARFKATSNAGKACADALYLAELYVKKLSVGDQVCLEGGFGEPEGRSPCTVRASIEDTSQQGVMLEIRDVAPGSKWKGKGAHQFWYDEAALIDLYLAERGY